MGDLAHVDDYPEIPVSLRSSRDDPTTGAWRNVRPVLAERGSACSASCPADVPIPRYLHHVAEGRFAEAFAVFTLFNPFPELTGRVCPRPCEDGCSRGGRDGSVSIRDLERFLGDRTAGLPHSPASASTGRSVAVVGSGPAGLAAAYYLRRSGHRVVVFEEKPLPGGMLRYGIPDYRLPSGIVDREIVRLADLGIEFRTGISLGTDLTLADLQDGFDAIFVATGAWRPRAMDLEGAELMRSGLEFLVGTHGAASEPPPGHCAVIGGGNTAIDVARTLRRLDGQVTVLYRRTEADMPAIAEEYRAAVEEEIAFEFLVLPRAVRRQDGALVAVVERMRPGPPDDSGRPRPEPTGETAEMRFDAVFSAIGEDAEVEPFPDDFKSDDGWLAVGEAGATKAERIFVGGDLATGPSTVVAAIGWGRRSAHAINERIGGGYEIPDWALANGAGVVGGDDVNPATFVSRPPRRGPRLGPAERLAAGGAEEAGVMAEEDAIAEIGRCYSCGHCNSCGTCFVFCPDLAIRWEDEPVFDYAFCKGCDICTTECPGHVILSVKEEVAVG